MPAPVVVVAVVVSNLLFAAPAAQAEPPLQVTTYYTLQVLRPQPSSPVLFVGVQAPARRDGDRVVLMPHDPANLRHQWAPVGRSYPSPEPITSHDPSPTYLYKFVNRHSGKCLTIQLPGTANGSVVFQYACRSGGSLAGVQVWGLNGMRTSSGDIRSVPIPSASSRYGARVGNFFTRCLDVTDFKLSAGTQLQMWNCNRPVTWNQKFQFIPFQRLECRTYSTVPCGSSRP